MPTIHRFMLAAVAAISFVLVCTPTSFAKTISASVRANTVNAIGFITVKSVSGCAQGARPKMDVHQPPEHGTVSFRWAMAPKALLSRVCRNVPMKGIEIIYTPARGYRGHDHFEVGGRFPTYIGDSVTSYHSDEFDVDVR